jgi:hypothetical protein
VSFVQAPDRDLHHGPRLARREVGQLVSGHPEATMALDLDPGITA